MRIIILHFSFLSVNLHHEMQLNTAQTLRTYHFSFLLLRNGPPLHSMKNSCGCFQVEWLFKKEKKNV